MGSLSVRLPWGWIWWDKNIPLLPGDPDLLDGTVRYPESTINWAQVALAVTWAVSRRGNATDVLRTGVQVPLPFSLGHEEKLAVVDWLAGGASRIVRLCEPHLPTRRVENGRHRLWGTWPHFTDAVPVLSDTALYFHNAYPADPDKIASSLKDQIGVERAWWESEAPDSLVRHNRHYIAGLSVCYSIL